jgi:hypothetical protein
LYGAEGLQLLGYSVTEENKKNRKDIQGLYKIRLRHELGGYSGTALDPVAERTERIFRDDTRSVSSTHWEDIQGRY